MNRRYRLVWSKVHSAWIAVAEFARSLGKSKSQKIAQLRVQASKVGNLLPTMELYTTTMTNREQKSAPPTNLKPLYLSLLLAFAPNLFAAIVTAPAVNTLPTGGVVTAGVATIGSVGSTMDIHQATQNAVYSFSSFDIGVAAAVNVHQNNRASVGLIHVNSNTPSRIFGQLNADGHIFLLNPSGTYFAPGSQVNVGGLIASTMHMDDNGFMNGNYTLNNPGGSLIEALGNINAGSVALVGNNISNGGNIVATQVSLVSGNTVAIDLTGNNLIRARIIDPALSASISNSGTINAAMITMSSGQAKNAINSVVNNSGTIRAVTLASIGGDIYLEGNTVSNTGTLNASGSLGGGTVKVMGDMNNGRVNVGGNIKAQATQSGNGGFVKTSAAHVKVADDARVNTLAINGLNGSWLIDPVDFTVAASGGDMTGAAVQVALAGGNFSILSSSGVNGVNGDININDAISWSANNLSISAARDININALMTASGSSSLTMTTGTSVAGGKVLVGKAFSSFLGRVDFGTRYGSGFLTINGNNYKVLNGLGSQGSTTGQDLQGMTPSGYYALGADIDASATSTWNSGSGFNPLTFNNGAINGLGHLISNLTINRAATNQVGLIGTLSGTTTNISNIGLTGVNVMGGTYVGGLIGQVNEGNIFNTFSSGNITAQAVAGGLIGTLWNGGILSDSHSSGTVTSTDSTRSNSGGLVGLMANGTDTPEIYRSFSTAAVTGSARVGGLVGWVQQGNIYNSHASGAVTGRVKVGGLVGTLGQRSISAGLIQNSYASGSVTGDDDVGGLVGVNNSSSSINASYATGNVTGGGVYAGGLTGENKGTISYSHATGNVIGINFVGGIAGGSVGTISYSYSSGDVSGGDNTGGVAGKVLSGSVTDSYHKLGNISRNIGVGTGFNFGGVVGNCDGCSITHSYNTAAVSGHARVGGLAGKLYNATVSGSFNTGKVTGDSTSRHVGGFVGYSDVISTITDSYSSGNVSGDQYVGGLVGTNANDSTVTRSYSTGSVSGSLGVGGLIGSSNFGGLVSNSFWNTTTSVQPSSEGGTGMTTAYMRTQANFTSATAANGSVNPEWDFTSTWVMYEGNTSPLLRYFMTPLTVTANNATKNYDGAAYSGSVGVSYSATPNMSHLLGTASYSSGISVGKHPITPSGFYSDQFGYILNFVDGTLTINPSVTPPVTNAITAESSEIVDSKKIIDKITNVIKKDSNNQDAQENDSSVLSDKKDLQQTVQVALVSEDGVKNILQVEVPKGKVLSCQ